MLYNCIVDRRSSEALVDRVHRTGKTNPMLIHFLLFHIEGKSRKKQKCPLACKIKMIRVKEITPITSCFGSLKNISYTGQGHKLKAKSNLFREADFIS